MAIAPFWFSADDTCVSTKFGWGGGKGNGIVFMINSHKWSSFGAKSLQDRVFLFYTCSTCTYFTTFYIITFFYVIYQKFIYYIKKQQKIYLELSLPIHYQNYHSMENVFNYLECMESDQQNLSQFSFFSFIISQRNNSLERLVPISFLKCIKLRK